MIYDIIAPAYDKINGEVDYVAWADFFEAVIEKHATAKPELVLDIGSGTGSMTLELAKRGYDMTGVDSSCEMLDIARERADRAGLSDKMLWLMQDMTEFELYGTVDLTVSCLDCINHLNSRELDKCLNLVHNYLLSNKILISFKTLLLSSITFSIISSTSLCLYSIISFSKSSLLICFWLSIVL